MTRSNKRSGLRALCVLVPLGSLLLVSVAAAGKADVLAVKVKREEAGTYRFDVTVRHADEGWKHYADKWEVVGPDGKVLASRILRHPHVQEQPFTRRLSGVKIPAAVRRVTVRAYDSQHGGGGKEVTVTVPR